MNFLRIPHNSFIIALIQNMCEYDINEHLISLLIGPVLDK